MTRVAVSIATALVIATGLASSGPANADVSVTVKIKEPGYDRGTPRYVWIPGPRPLVPPAPVGQPSPSRGVVTIAEPPYPVAAETYVEGEEEECLVRKKKLYDPYSGKWLVKTTSICR